LQTTQDYSDYQAGYAIEDRPHQQQKIYPSTQHKLHKALWIITLILSSIGFFFTIAGIVVSALVLEPGREAMLAGRVVGLISSIVACLICVAIFVITVIVLAGQTKRPKRL
jgi:hypothetical protein